MLGDIVTMQTKNLKSLVIKHFNFLKENYGFKYDAESNCYSKNNLSMEVQHESGELKLVFNMQNGKELFLMDVLIALREKEFSYPEHFSNLILSMGDVDSRLAYDAKLIKEYCQEVLDGTFDLSLKRSS